jgi:hypothetical protein
MAFTACRGYPCRGYRITRRPQDSESLRRECPEDSERPSAGRRSRGMYGVVGYRRRTEFWFDLNRLISLIGRQHVSGSICWPLPEIISHNSRCTIARSVAALLSLFSPAQIGARLQNLSVSSSASSWGFCNYASKAIHDHALMSLLTSACSATSHV